MELVFLLIAVALWLIGAVIKGISKAISAAKNSWDSQNAPVNYRPVPQDQPAPVAPPVQPRPTAPLMERLPDGLQNTAKGIFREFGTGANPPAASQAKPAPSFGTYPGAVPPAPAVRTAAVQTARAQQAPTTREAEVERQAGDIQGLAQAPAILPAVIGLSRDRDQWLKAIILQEALGPPLSRRRKTQ